MLNFMKKALASIGLTQQDREITDAKNHQISFNPLRLSDATSTRGVKYFGLTLSVVMFGLSIYYGVTAGTAIFGLFIVSDVLDLAYTYRDQSQLGFDQKVCLQQAA